MATYDSIREHINHLEDLLLRATTTARCLTNAETGDDQDIAAWVALFGSTVHDLNKAGQQVIEDMNTKAIPLMADMAKLAGGNRNG